MRRGGAWLIVMLAGMFVVNVLHAQQVPAQSEKIFARVGDDVITMEQYRAYLQDGMRRRFFHGDTAETGGVRS